MICDKCKNEKRLTNFYKGKVLGSGRTKAEIGKLCHYTNLQPLSKSKHIEKTRIDIQNIKAIKSAS